MDFIKTLQASRKKSLQVIAVNAGEHLSLGCRTALLFSIQLGQTTDSSSGCLLDDA
jgi:hypothetical protein